MKKTILALLIIGLSIGCQTRAFCEARLLYGFEKGLKGWEIPDWAFEKDDCVGESIEVSSDYASEGKSSLKIMANFPGNRWTAAVAEVMEFCDWTPYSTVSCDVMVPQDAPIGLKAKIVLTVGDEWTWTEMSRSISLEPGKWITISANLKPGSTDWKKTNPIDEFRADVRKIDIRIESNRKPAYKGPVYIDNILVE